MSCELHRFLHMNIRTNQEVYIHSQILNDDRTNQEVYIYSPILIDDFKFLYFDFLHIKGRRGRDLLNFRG